LLWENGSQVEENLSFFDAGDDWRLMGAETGV
jgi:hypothetical protein